MKKIFYSTLGLLLVVVLVGACNSKASVSDEQEVVSDTIQVEEAVDSLAGALQAEAEAVDQLAEELK